MKYNTVQQEILLITNSHLPKLKYCNKENDNAPVHCPVDLLEQACWNGMLEELMRGILLASSDGRKLLLWHIQRAQNFLHLDLCEEPASIDYEHSIDPYFFVSYCQRS